MEAGTVEAGAHTEPRTATGKRRRQRREVAVDDPMLRPREVAQMVGLDYATIYRARKAGRFPEPIQLTAQAIGWRTSTIKRWLDERQR